MLAIITAVTVGVIAIIAYFALSYVRLLGANNEQKTAIEAAALSAARDMSTIGVNTPEYGWVAISDAAPTGSGTVAGDLYKMPVKGINTIMATIRLDLIIANRLNDDKLKTIIAYDLTKAKAAQAALVAHLKNAILPGKTVKDISNKDVSIYANAEAAYKSNQIRQTGSSSYKAGSLKLTLGSLQGGAATNTPLPSPNSWASVASANSEKGFYKSYVNVPVNDTPFVFAGIGDAIRLVDPKNWTDSVSGLPYQAQTIIKAEATTEMVANQTKGVAAAATACAQPANIADPKSAPGALTFSFPDGLCPEVPGPGTMLTSVTLNQGDNTSYQSSTNGDFPIGAPTTMFTDLYFPYVGLDQSTGNVFRKALFDWWKRAGTHLNMASAVAMFTDSQYNFNKPSPETVDWKSPAEVGDTTIYKLGPIPNGNIHIYRIDPNTGGITYQTKELEPVKYSVASEGQLYSENINAIQGSKVGQLKVGPFEFPNTGVLFDEVWLLDKWDIYIRDQVFQAGNEIGGKHSGEPMDFNKVAFANTDQLGGMSLGARPPQGKPPQKGQGLPPAITTQSDFAESAKFPLSFYNTYSQGPGNNGIRPTYQTNGMAVDIRFRRQVNPGTFSDSLGIKIGYVGEKYGPNVPAVNMNPVPVNTGDTGSDSGADSGAGSGADSGAGSGADSGSTGGDAGSTGG